jgi:hypothetical protein
MTDTQFAPQRADNFGALFAALATAQGAFLPIEKNRSVKITMKTGGSYNFRYADLEEILAKTRPALSSNGLAMFQLMDTGPNHASLRCELVHKDGARLCSEVSIPHPHTIQDPKQFGATVSYFRRYMVTAMLGVAADDDLDEDGEEMKEAAPQSGAGKPAVTQPQRRQAPPVDRHAEAQPEAPAATNGESVDASAATAGEISFITKKIKTAGKTIAQARDAAGIDPGETLDGLLKFQFTALKNALA